MVTERELVEEELRTAEYRLREAPMIEIFGRLEPGADIDDARRQAELVGKRLAAIDSVTHGGLLQRIVPYTRTFIDNGDAIWTYHLIQVIVTLLLVVIGANVAVLVYARTAGRVARPPAALDPARGLECPGEKAGT